VVLKAFAGPLDLLLHLVRSKAMSIWDIPIAEVCDQYHAAVAAMEELDLEVAGEYLVYAAWLAAIKSRALLPRPEGEEDPRSELVERLLEYEKVKAAATELAALEEVRRGMIGLRVHAGAAAPAEESGEELGELDVARLATTLVQVLQRFRREHPAQLELPPLRYSVREKMVELYQLIERQRSFPLLSHLLTRPDRLESVTLLVAGLELVRLNVSRIHQRLPFAEIYLTPTGVPLQEEALADV
jgi:segregation and condensation protein A